MVGCGAPAAKFQRGRMHPSHGSLLLSNSKSFRQDATLGNLIPSLFVILGTVVGLFSTKYDDPLPDGSNKPDFDIMTNYMQAPEKETLKKGDFLRSLSVTPSPTIAAPVPYYTTTSTTAMPAYSANLMHTRH